MSEKKLTICYLTNSNSIHAQRWVKYFVDKGHRIHLISPYTALESSDIKNAKFQSHIIRKRYPFPINYFRNSILFIKRSSLLNQMLRPLSTLLYLILISLPRLIHVRKLIKEINPDLLHAQDLAYGKLAALIDFHPLIVSPFGSDILIAPQSKIERVFIKYTLNKANLIICYGENTREVVVNYGISPQKIQIIHYGIDIQRFKPEPRDKKRTFGFDSPTVLTLRRPEPVYDLETLIKAIPTVLKEISDVKFIISSRGTQKEYLIDLAKSLNVFHATKFIDWIPDDEIPDYLRAGDVYVSTSLSDGGLAASIVEAMACGLPVIVTDNTDNRKWIKDGENGFIVPIKEPETLANKIILLLKREHLRISFSRACRKIIQENFEYNNEMSKVEKLYYELVEKHKKAYGKK